MAKISYDVEALDLLRKNVGDVETAFSELEKKTLTITNSLLRVLKGGTTTNFDKKLSKHLKVIIKIFLR